ncbi:DJ-1/PfpI family protein [Kordiimonas aquimaris]|uniref:DJ-1/PfpI family protein n=1 Tax=Kordiimonas aquimaris TaxID=707591 RepID=UPI0021CF2EC8|nr:DJ-1/PfpI family protein [Kordiimonas aquimaris]
MSEQTPVSITFMLFDGITQLDLMGPAQVLSRLGNTTVHLVAKDVRPVSTDSGFPLMPTASMNEVKSTDILCIPGGFGTLEVMKDTQSLDWVKEIAETATWITSVCTGSLILGAAGLLKGYKAACHWASRDQLSYFGAIPTAERIVFDRNRASGGGVTSGIDFGLALAAKIRGEDYAKFIQLSLEYDPAPPFTSGSPDKASEATLKQYQDMVNKFAPDRDQTVQKIAQDLGFD